ncbi:unnamed protein product, partial [Ixodes pacificus]
LERGLQSQRAVFSQQTQQNELLTLASYDVAHELAKRGKPFTDGEMVKDCTLRMATRLFPDKSNIIRNVSLAPNTVARKVEDIGTNITCQIAEKAKQFTHYSLALDESTDVCDTSQLLVFIRGVDSEFNVTEELASVHSMHGTVTREDIFKELEKTVSEYNLEWGKLKSNMSGVRKGLVAQITKAAEVGGLTKPMFLHCMIHQQALCGKYVDMSCDLKPVASAVNYVRSHGLNHRQFREFLKDGESEFVDVTYYTAVRWLSCDKVLSRLFNLREEIRKFLADKNRPEPLLSNSEWLWKLAFCVDLTEHMNKLNVKLQGETRLIHDIYKDIKGFRAKLQFFERQVRNQNWEHFPCCGKLRTDTDAEFPSFFAMEIL